VYLLFKEYRTAAAVQIPKKRELKGLEGGTMKKYNEPLQSKSLRKGN